MRKDEVIFFLLLILIVEFSLASFIDESINQKFLSGEKKVKVIISFNESFLDENYKVQDIEKKDRFDIIAKKHLPDIKINSFITKHKEVSAYVDKRELERLRNVPYIKGIYLEPEFKLFLNESVPLIRANYTWNLRVNLTNLTGANQTICVIDTGIDYTHPDFGGCTKQQLKSGNCEKILGGYAFFYPINPSDPLDIMDDNGHGTHVSGIIAANGLLKGVARNSRIIGIRACGFSSGICDYSSIVNGLDWCINNRTKYNISIISMSLGTEDYYSTFCDNYIQEGSPYDTMRDKIEEAVFNNISVIIASGNEGQKNKISFPACLKNATAVGSSTKSDGVSSFSNRWIPPMIFAPGEYILSTFVNGYAYVSGTSMAAPHVSGAVAIIRQYLNITNRTMTPEQIELVLNSTGKIIYDSATGRYYPRIDVYSAIISLDIYPPYVNLVSPENESLFLYGEQYNFTCNATDMSLKNVTFYLWDSTNDLINKTSSQISGDFYNFETNISNIGPDNYKWNCEFIDENGNAAFYESNFTINVLSVITTLNSPRNNKYTNQNLVSFNCSANTLESRSLENLTFYLWNSTGDLIAQNTSQVSGKNNDSVFEHNFTNEGQYFWTCKSMNNNSETHTAKNFSITYDKTKPEFDFVNINPGTYSVEIKVGTNEETNKSVNILTNALSNSTFSKNHSFYFSGLSPSTRYSFEINSCDRASNCKNYSGEFYTREEQKSYTSSGSGGGSSSSKASAEKASILKNYSLNHTEFGLERSFALSKGDKILLNTNTSNHTITLINFSRIHADFEAKSSPINFSLFLEEEKKLNLSSNEFYDIYVRLNSIDSKVNVTIKLIYEPIDEKNKKEYKLVEEVSKKEEEPRFSLILVLFSSILVIILLVAILLLLFSKKLKKTIAYYEVYHDYG